MKKNKENRSTEIEKDKLEEFLRIALDKAKNVLLQQLLGERLIVLETDLYKQQKKVSKLKSGDVLEKIWELFILLFYSIGTTAVAFGCCWCLVFMWEGVQEVWQAKEIFFIVYFFAFYVFMFFGGCLILYLAISFLVLFIKELVSLFRRGDTNRKGYPNAEVSHWIVEMEMRKLGDLMDVNHSTLKQIYKSGLLTFRRDFPDIWAFQLHLQFMKLKLPYRGRLLEGNLGEYIYGFRSSWYRLNYTDLYRPYEQFAKIAAIYEYITSDRCVTLEGEDGAYQRLKEDEKEQRLMAVMRQLVADPEQYKDSRPFLYREYMDVMETLEQIMTSHEELFTMIGSMNLNEELLEEMTEEEEKQLDDELGNIMADSGLIHYLTQRAAQEIREKDRLRQMRLLDIKIPKEFELDTRVEMKKNADVSIQ